MIFPHNRKNLIVPCKPRTFPYIEIILGPEVNYVEVGLHNYFVLMEDEQEPCAYLVIEDDECWKIQFDGASSTEGNGSGIILFSPIGKLLQYSFWLNFECMNNVMEFEALALGLQKALELGC